MRRKPNRWKIDPLSAIALTLLMVGLAVFGYAQLRPSIAVDSTTPAAADTQSQSLAPQKVAEPETILVHVTGEVAAPGVVELEEGARALDAVEAAGGMTAEARPESLNLAQKVKDGQNVHVGAEGEESLAADSGMAAENSSCVDLNTATVERLQDLDGVGPALAERIVAHRDEFGPFESPEAVIQVTGIGTKKLRGMIDGICP